MFLLTRAANPIINKYIQIILNVVSATFALIIFISNLSTCTGLNFRLMQGVSFRKLHNPKSTPSQRETDKLDFCIYVGTLADLSTHKLFMNMKKY